SVTLVVVYAIAVLIWAYIDGAGDARRNPDPDRRADLAMTWLVAGLFAGIVSGAVSWIIGLFYKNFYVEGLLNEITTFAAFTALLIFLVAVAGVTLGRWIVDRKAPPAPKHDHDGEDRADTDVFAAVNAGKPSEETEKTGPVDIPEQHDK